MRSIFRKATRVPNETEMHPVFQRALRSFQKAVDMFAIPCEAVDKPDEFAWLHYRVCGRARPGRTKAIAFAYKHQFGNIYFMACEDILHGIIETPMLIVADPSKDRFAWFDGVIFVKDSDVVAMALVFDLRGRLPILGSYSSDEKFRCWASFSEDAGRCATVLVGKDNGILGRICVAERDVIKISSDE